MGKLKEALKGIGEVIVDFQSLEVMTLSGNVSGMLDDKGQINWAGLLQAAAGQKSAPPGQAVTTTGTLKLVAATKVYFGGDVVQFRTDEKIDGMEELIKLHQDAVEAGRSSRRAVIEFFAQAIREAVS
jgi:hypothetical protein